MNRFKFVNIDIDSNLSILILIQIIQRIQRNDETMNLSLTKNV